MSGFQGMDVEAVRSLAQQMSAKAEEIEHLSNALSSQLDGTQWVGHDAVSFRGEWSGAHRSQLAAVANALRDASTAAGNNANQQEQASA
jgi:uncharacterized protein YukE